MGPPCGPRDGWALLEVDGEKRLYCSIWRSYQDDFNRRQIEGIRLADQRWKEWYGSLTAGPKNNGCYAWNWQECFAVSIYDPAVEQLPPPGGATEIPVLPEATSTNAPLFEVVDGQDDTNSIESVWSTPQTALDGAVTWSWSLQNVTTVRPQLLMELVYTFDEELDDSSLDRQYVGFGVAEQVMEGAMVVCYPQPSTPTVGGITAATRQAGTDDMVDHITTCQTFVGSGMGISKPATDPVQPMVLLSELTANTYRVRFSANLFACWSNPHWPARLLFSRGLVSGNGDPMPHLNNEKHRQAIPGIELLSVVLNQNTATIPDVSPPPAAKVLDPLPSGSVTAVPGTTGTLEVLEGRVNVAYELLQYGEDPVIQVQLQNVEVLNDDDDDEPWYVGFGFAPDTMSGLIMTCTPRLDTLDEFSVTCQQWRGLGTNLYPRNLVVDAGGWILERAESNGTHVDYTFVGRAEDVLSEDASVTTETHLRAILAVGRAAPDTGTPLMHTSRDRTVVVFDQLATAIAAPSSRDPAGDSGSVSSSFMCLGMITTAAMMVLLSS